MKRFLLILLLFPSFLFSQEEISLEKAIELGLSSSFNIVQARHMSKISGQQNTLGVAGAFPTISANIAAGNSFLDQSQNPTAFIQDLISTNSILGGADMTWVLFNGFKMHIQKDIFQKYFSKSELEVSMAIQNQIHAITQTYYEILIQEKILDQYEANLIFSMDKLKYANIKKDMDYIAPIDFLLIKEAALNDSILYIEQVNSIKLVRKQLYFLCDLDRTQPYKLTTQLDIDFIEESYEMLQDRIIESSAVQQMAFDLKIKQLEQKSAVRNLYPTVSFNSGARVSRSSNTIGDVKSIPGTNINYYANFSLNYKLFDGGRERKQVAIKKIEEEIASESKEQLTEELLHEFNNYYDSYNYHLSALSLSKQILVINQDIQSKANELYKSGTYSHVQLREIQLRSIEGITAYYRQLKSLIDSKLEIERLTQR